MTLEYTAGSGIALMKQSQGEKGFGDSEEGKDRDEEQAFGGRWRGSPKMGRRCFPCVKWKDTKWECW